jgi:hypothetical protein
MKIQDGWEHTALTWIHKLLLLAAVLVTTPTTYWFIQTHVPEPAWYPFCAVLFVDGGAFFWFYNLQYRTRSHGQTIIAALMFGLSVVAMAAAFSLQMLGVVLPEEARPVLEVVIVAVILLNIVSGLFFEFFDPEQSLSRAARQFQAQETSHKAQAVQLSEHAEASTRIAHENVTRELELTRKKKELAELQLKLEQANAAIRTVRLDGNGNGKSYDNPTESKNP